MPGTSNHDSVLRACEAAIERLATDRHYFAQPGAHAVPRHPDLFPDVRAAEGLRGRQPLHRRSRGVLRDAPPPRLRRQRQPAAVPRDDAQGHGVPARCRCRTTATARRTSTSPRPRTSRRCGSPLAAGREREAAHRAASLRGALCLRCAGCFWASTSAGPSPTPSSRRRRGSSPAKAPTTPDDQSRGRDGRGRRRARARRRASAGDVERFAHGMTVATNALLEGAGARTALIATEGFTDVDRARPPGPRRTSTACAPPDPRRSSPPELRFGAPERMTPDGLLARARRRRRRRAVDAGRRARARGGRRRAAARLPPPRARAARSRDALARAPARRPRLALARRRRHVPRVRARRDDRGRRRALARCSAATCAGSAERARDGRACPSPQIMQSNGGLADLDARRRATPPGPCSPGRPAARPARRLRRPRPPASRRARASTWAAPRATSASIDGGAVRETAGARDRRPPARAADARRPHGRRRRRLDRLARRRRRAARRSALGGRRPRPRLLRPRRRPSRPSPTRTCCSATCDDDAPLAGGVALDERRRRARGRRARRALGHRPTRSAPTASCASPTPRWSRALRVVTVERGIDPRGYALVPFGGAGPAARRRRWREELGIDAHPLPARVRRARRARPRRRRPPPRRPAHRAAARRRASPPRRSRARRGGPRRRGARDARASRTPSCVCVYELRYRGQAFELAVERDGVGRPRRPARGVRRELHEERYGYRDPSRRSSSSPCA